MQLLKLLPLFFELFSNHAIVLHDFALEILTIPQGLLNLSLETSLILNPLAAVGDKLLCEFLDFIGLFLELLDGLAFDLDHLFEVVALEDEVRNGLLVVCLVDSADLDQHVQSFVLEKREGVLELYFLDLLLNFTDLLLFLFDLLLVLELALVVVLDDLQLFQSLRQDLVFVKIRVHLFSDRLIVLLEFFKLFHHLFVDILLDSWKQSLLCSVQVTN